MIVVILRQFYRKCSPLQVVFLFFLLVRVGWKDSGERLKEEKRSNKREGGREVAGCWVLGQELWVQAAYVGKSEVRLFPT